MGLRRDRVYTKDGKILFVPSGSGNSGTRHKYAVTMSGASVSASILAPHQATSSFWYVRSAKNYSVKIFYQTTGSTAIEPTGSHLYQLSNVSKYSSGSVVPVIVNKELTGSNIVRATVEAMRRNTSVMKHFTISQSYTKPHGGHIFIFNDHVGVPPADDISFSYITGSTFSYNIRQSGSNSTISKPSTISGSATAVFRLAGDDKDQLETAMEDSRSFINIQDGHYGISVTQFGGPTTGSNVSLHGGIPFDYGQPLPNSPFIRTNGGFDILMDNGGVLSNSAFRIFKDAGIPGLGTELLHLDNDGNLTVAGTISDASGSIDGGSF